jgi:hypothetical protein
MSVLAKVGAVGAGFVSGLDVRSDDRQARTLGENCVTPGAKAGAQAADAPPHRAHTEALMSLTAAVLRPARARAHGY